MLYRLSVLTRAKRYFFFMPILPCLVAFCQAFPPLYDDVAALLVQVGQVCASDVATKARDIDPSITRTYDACGRNGSRRTAVASSACSPVCRSAVSKGEAQGGHGGHAGLVQADVPSEDSRRTRWSGTRRPALLLRRGHIHGYHQLHPSWTIDPTERDGSHSYWFRGDNRTAERTSVHSNSFIFIKYQPELPSPSRLLHVVHF